MKRLLSLAWLALVSCDDGERFSPVVLDTSPNCARASAEVLVPNLDRPEQPWSRVIGVALDEPGRLDFWALVEVDDAAAQFAMMHVRDGAVDHRVDLTDFLPNTVDVELRPGPAAGSAWLVESGPGSYRLWQFEAVGVGVNPLRAVSPNLSWFPGSLAQLCTDGETDPFEEPQFTTCDVTDWHRDLAFVEGQAFLLSTPPFSPNATMYVYAGRLRADLGITEQTQLEFFRRCNDEILEMVEAPCVDVEQTTYPSLIVMGSQQDPSDPVHHQFILRDRETNRIPVARESVGLALDLDEDNKLRGFVFSRALDEVTVAEGPPSGLATDSVATYLLHPTEEGAAGVTRLRTDAPGDGYVEDRFDVLSGIPLPEDPQELALLQLPGDVALGWIEQGAWEILKLFPDAPSSSERSRYAPDAAVTAVRSAGRGAYLVFKDHELGPDLVQVRCSEAD
ncbi:MAG: hypothetical protein ACRBN8_31495 [Nannocystales bacterium]